MGVFVELWFLTIPAVLIAFVLFVILNSIFNPKPGPGVRAPASGVGPADSGAFTSAGDSFYFITDSVGSSAGSSDGAGSSGDFDPGSGSGGGGGDSSGSGDTGGSSDSGTSSSD